MNETAPSYIANEPHTVERDIVSWTSDVSGEILYYERLYVLEEEAEVLFVQLCMTDKASLKIGPELLRWTSRSRLAGHFEMDLLQTRGVAKVTFAPNYDAPNPFSLLIGSLASNDPLAQKLSTQLQGPCATVRRDPERPPVMPETYSALLPAIKSAQKLHQFVMLARPRVIWRQVMTRANIRRQPQMPLVFQPLGYHSAPAACFPLTPVPSEYAGLSTVVAHLVTLGPYIADFLLAELYGTGGPGVPEQGGAETIRKRKHKTSKRALINQIHWIETQ